MIYIDVDTAVVVPVNVMPLLDDTDFKTRETGVAYNAAGMDLVWNFVTSAGVVTQTAVTPTTGGSYDWTHVGDGMYSIEIPASGGASINNDTEGYGYFTGVATGVLPWRGPTICFRASGLNDLLTDSAYSTTRGLAGTALPAAAADAAGGLPISDAGGLDLDAKVGALTFTVAGKVDANVTHVSGDSAAADNLEAAADGTGYNLGGGQVVAASVTGAVGSVTGAVGSVTGNVGGNVTGSVGSVVGAVGSVTGAVGSVTGNVGGNVAGSVGSVTGNVGGNVVGSVGSVAAGGITAASIATGAVDADAIAADAVAEIADGVWDEAQSGHTTAGTFGKYLDSEISGVSSAGAKGPEGLVARSGSTYSYIVWLKSAGVIVTGAGLTACSVTIRTSAGDLVLSGSPSIDTSTGLITGSGTLTTALSDNTPAVVYVSITHSGTAYVAPVGVVALA